MKQTRCPFCIPPPATRFQLVPAFFDTRDTLTPNFFYSPYSVLCTLSSTYNKSQRMSMYFYKPDMRLSFKNTLLAMISIILLQVTLLCTKKKCENMCTLPCRLGAQAPLHQPKQRFLVCSEKLLGSLGFTFQYSILRGRAM